MADLLDFDSRPLLSLLPEGLAARLSAAATPVDYDDGETIHSRGDDKPGLSIIQSGAVRFAIPGADGSYITTSILGPGHCFGEAILFAHLPRAYDAIAVGETRVEQISKPRFDRIFDEEPALARLMLEATTQRLYAVLEFLDDVRRLPLLVRTAKMIAGMARSAKNAEEVECSQSDLAFTLGVSRVSIGKALSGLQDERLIVLGYGRIGVPDRAALDQWIADRTPLQALKRGE
ncbi:Crp/Fnr family transcriptional regulator [Hyphococcus luteus]|uniref:Crp/Fnr family transcriptional regulator n=1 Tax=Hyphococcus luteus TaxID=2058213 RepID=A0A2S7K0C4_9PROT|nr:Crp/Fnr family transcriptional regulator [Marinicaulis flavus]PQA85957.1 Crp/Fnr family transcriptional regulator [Marinicaulis flavus]